MLGNKKTGLRAQSFPSGFAGHECAKPKLVGFASPPSPPRNASYEELKQEMRQIVSGDGHLLGLKSFKGIKIVSVNEMLGLLMKS